ncbi:hypothetical protein C8F04DRAFT_1324206 [Mycena alexandri]|uniref:Uncharacterized protein n=1 Tax=Mycena alexandri TaxID=1745969 RepID=A0AAD6S2Q7_9AGAR|nr:hypothetical protein C8F04DRAFT_1324206 [Mycena alexandri]
MAQSRWLIPTFLSLPAHFHCQHLRLSRRSTPTPALLSLAKAPPVASYLMPDAACPVVKIGCEPLLTLHPPPPYTVDSQVAFKSQALRPSVKRYDRCPVEHGVKSSNAVSPYDAKPSNPSRDQPPRIRPPYSTRVVPIPIAKFAPRNSSPRPGTHPSLPINLRRCIAPQASTVQRVVSSRLPMRRQHPRTRTAATLQMSHDLTPSSSVNCKSSRPFPALKLKCPKSSSLMLQTVSPFNIGPQHSGANSGDGVVSANLSNFHKTRIVFAVFEKMKIGDEWLKWICHKS